MRGKGNASDSPTQTHHQSEKIETPRGETPSLPQEIIVEILTRLPVKSLLKFRCVSKSWLSLISSPQFIKSHLRISTKEASFSKYRVMFTVPDLGHKFKHCSLRSLIYEPLTEACNMENAKPRLPGDVVGSCNGLICIATFSENLFLWNPSTGRSTKLPPAPVKMNPGQFNIFGFGYNESTDDYKVLSTSSELRTAEVWESVAHLYSLKTNSWKRIEDFRGRLPLGVHGKFADGKLHFYTIQSRGLEIRSDIVFLDLDTETYGMVEPPNYGDGLFDSPLGVLGGRICMFCIYRKIRTDVWVLKEHGIKESWTKVATISYFNEPKDFLMLPNGEVLLFSATGLVVYSPRDDCLRHPKISEVFLFLGVDVYVESLVSPVGN